MKTVTQHIRDRLLRGFDFQEMRRTQWSDEFVSYMRNRMIMGYYRYGSIRDPKVPARDHVASMQERLQLYLDTGNQEYLVDVANICLVEFVRKCNRPDAFFRSVDDGVHTQEL